jgi:hypothetical protein
MAHFAEIDENNIVINVVVLDNKDIIDENGKETESKGIEFLKAQCGNNTNWVQTSYNGKFRKRYAGIGFYYDKKRDAFISPKLFPSWIFDDNVCAYVPIIPYPNDGKYYSWNEAIKNWEEFIINEPEPISFGSKEDQINT